MVRRGELASADVFGFTRITRSENLVLLYMILHQLSDFSLKT